MQHLTTYKNSADVIGATIQSILPNRRNLTEAVSILSYILTWERQQILPTACAVIEIMTSDPLTTCLQVKLAVYALPWDELVPEGRSKKAEGRRKETLFYKLFKLF